jgi:dynamin GTPase
MVEQELVRLGEQRVQTSEGTRAIALELCREFEDKFLQHIDTGEGTGWKVVASFESILPKRIKGLPLDSMFEMSSIKKVKWVGKLTTLLASVITCLSCLFAFENS